MKTDMTPKDAVAVAAFLRQLATLVERRCPSEAGFEANTAENGAMRSVDVTLRW